jgi:hypothetical protein
MKEHWIEETVIEVSVITILAVLMLSLIAPILGPWIRAKTVRKYALYPDAVQRADAEMKGVYVGLTVWAIVAWAVLIWLSHG